ncbi:MAG: prenyltransferase, partial [Chloroflexi bacterium]|nr:prenyltransferase [Chloroflexota bacterium]
MNTVKLESIPSLTFAQRLHNWREILDTANLSKGKPMDRLSKWLLITRAAVFSMTITSALIGGLLAAATPGAKVNWFYFALALIGLVLAHATNNMLNDYFDFTSGLDTADYPRVQYAPHPLVSGLTTRRGLLAAIGLTNGLDVAIGLVLTWARGPLVLLFAALGLFISVFYVMKPIVLKRRGLGEIGVLLAWGPLMIGGTYFVAAGTLPDWIWSASLPYALIVMSVLMGKHLDKYEVDQAKGVRTLPVLLGFQPALRFNQALMVGFYAVIAFLILTHVLAVWVSLVALAIPRLLTVLKIYEIPKPTAPPPGYPVWPLWYVSWAFYFNKRAGELFVLGLVLN